MGKLNIPKNSRVYLDTSIIIYSIEKFSDYFPLLQPLSRSILREAANFRGTTGLKTPDAIHGATALASRCDLLLTNDRDFQKLSVLPVLILDDILTG